LRYIATVHKEEIFPCLIQKGKKVIEWKTHKDLDDWHDENGDTFNDFLLKGFHRAFQLRGDNGRSCHFGDPTMVGDSTEENPEKNSHERNHK